MKNFSLYKNSDGYKNKYFDIVLAVVAAVVLSALMATFILAFRKGLLPYASDGNAFDTIYAIDQNENTENAEDLENTENIEE